MSSLTMIPKGIALSISKKISSTSKINCISELPTLYDLKRSSVNFFRYGAKLIVSIFLELYNSSWIIDMDMIRLLLSRNASITFSRLRLPDIKFSHSNSRRLEITCKLFLIRWWISFLRSFSVLSIISLAIFFSVTS